MFAGKFFALDGALPAIMYGLSETDKPDCPLRPILSAVSTFNYKLAKVLVPVLTPITTSEYTFKDFFL